MQFQTLKIVLNLAGVTVKGSARWPYQLFPLAGLQAYVNVM